MRVGSRVSGLVRRFPSLGGPWASNNRGMNTMAEMHRLLHQYGWKPAMDLDDIESGRAPICDWTHPAIAGAKISTWKKKDVAWWGDPLGKEQQSDNTQQLHDRLKDLAHQK
jgi:hypothetical protein